MSTNTTALRRYESWPLSRLARYERNARTHSQEQVQAIAASIATFGFNAPILVDPDGVIVAGHGRFAAAQHLGLDEAPVLVLDHLTAQERRAYVLADNKLADMAGWDVELLRSEVLALDDDDGLGLLEAAGFSDAELNAFLGDGLLPDGVDPEARPGADIRQATGDGAAPKAGDGEGAHAAGQQGSEGRVEYTRKVEAPIYVPTAPECPEIGQLYQLGRAEQLLADIEQAQEIPDQVREFLRAAALRHTVFDYRNIAEFYARAPAAVQRLMEDSALVIIDYERAIELGYVRLSKRLGAIHANAKPLSEEDEQQLQDEGTGDDA